MDENIYRMDVLLVDFGGSRGSEQNKIRPAAVVSNDNCCKFSPVIIVMPFTSKKGKTKIPTHHLIRSDEGSGLMGDSLLIGEQPTPIDRCRVIRKLGHLSSKESQDSVDQACYDCFFYGKDGDHE